MAMKEQVEAMLTFIRDRKRAYQLTFQTTQPANVIVMQDLAKFCRAQESCVVPGDRDKTLVLEGRREVFLRIVQHLHLSEGQLAALWSSGTLKQEKNNG